MYVEICVYFLKSPDRSSSEILPVVAALISRQIASALIQLQLRQGRGFHFGILRNTIPVYVKYSTGCSNTVRKI